MKLSIITINYNDAVGLQRTLDSVAAQSIANNSLSSPTIAHDCPQSPIEIEHIIVDGGSTDGSVDVIRDYEKRLSLSLRLSLIWISEKDKGVYNAMNKGIKIATGDYIQILNSGDILASNDVIVRMNEALSIENTKRINASLDADKRLNVNAVDILYGNMLKAMPNGKIIRDTCGSDLYIPESFLYFYKGTLNHDCAWIKRTLFVGESESESDSREKKCFGLYDEQMRICSDWKWYVNAIALGLGVNSERLEAVKPVYVDLDVTIFDMNGISESGGKNRALIQQERSNYLKQILPASVLHDYDTYSFPIFQYQRLRKHHLWPLVHFMERVLFKLEKWGWLR